LDGLGALIVAGHPCPIPERLNPQRKPEENDEVLAIVVIAIALVGFAWATCRVLERIRNIRTKPAPYRRENDASDY
jgi:hypothetical protein